MRFGLSATRRCVQWLTFFTSRSSSDDGNETLLQAFQSQLILRPSLPPAPLKLLLLLPRKPCHLAYHPVSQETLPPPQFDHHLLLHLPQLLPPPLLFDHLQTIKMTIHLCHSLFQECDLRPMDRMLLPLELLPQWSNHDNLDTNQMNQRNEDFRWLSTGNDNRRRRWPKRRRGIYRGKQS